jgi:hypothetical protein
MRLEQLIQGNDSVRQMVATEREKEALLLVSPYARSAIKKEILPQLEESIGSKSDVKDLHEHVVKDIEEAFRLKNPTYTGLIKYKSIDQSDAQFLTDLIAVMDEWQRKTEESLSSGSSESTDSAAPAPGVQEVKVKLEVESDVDVKVKPQNTDAVKVEVKKPEGKKPEDIEDVTPTIEIPFDLLDMVL